ncbi:hypothetical protein [Hymenobacter elongatus]|uniref:hypothetical protein n=1 Tax=Hymenobacter elongatus TaxID=877208 RepID=UPI001436A409|nr:hypothetical protein [Hymenobacter elongatus]
MQLPDKMIINPVGTSVKSEADLLFFTLFSCQSGLTYDVLGLVCGMAALFFQTSGRFTRRYRICHATAAREASTKSAVQR